MGFTKEDIASFQRAADEGRAIYEAKVKAGLVLTPSERSKKADAAGIRVIRCGRARNES